jgi:hypothetical protein
MAEFTQSNQATKARRGSSGVLEKIMVSLSNHDLLLIRVDSWISPRPFKITPIGVG